MADDNHPLLDYYLIVQDVPVDAWIHWAKEVMVLEMVETKDMTHRFVDALADPALLAAITTPDVGMREYGGGQLRAVRGFERVQEHFKADWHVAADTSVEWLSGIETDERASVEYRVLRTLGGPYTEEYRSAFLQLRDGLIHTIDVYRTSPLPTAHRHDWIAPATLSHEEMGRLFAEWNTSWDPRERIFPNADFQYGLWGGYGGSGDPHPGSNWVGGFNYADDEADARIEALIEFYRQRNIGFQWYVSPFDRPTDLRERLERHGLILAGDQVGMARVGLEPVDIPTNPALSIRPVDGSDPQAIEDTLRITAQGFHWTPEQVEHRRQDFYERFRDPQSREHRAVYLAYLNSQPVAYGQVIYKVGVAYLGGAATIPEARNQRVYSTLLAHRLQAAHERGYHVAIIHAEPMSRRVVTKYGFRPYGTFYIYGWMPQPDMAVIRSLVPQD